VRPIHHSPVSVAPKEGELSPATPYLALATFPLVAWVVLNPTRFSWGFHHGLEPIPAELRDKAEFIDRLILLPRDAIAIGCVAGLMLWQSVPPTLAGLRLDQWKTNIAIGVAAGALRVAAVSALFAWVPGTGQGTTAQFTRTGSTSLWLLIDLVGVFAEEFWIAFCLVALRETGHAVALSVTIVAIVFGAMHWQYRFWGALATAALGAVACLLFLWRDSLVPTFLFHFIGNLGGLYWLRRGPPVGMRRG
jgi:membrane protease YdiL (CAAX protease family)